MKTSKKSICEISIIIVNYRSERYLKDNLTSIYNNIIPETNYEIILINNDEKEDLEKIRSEFPDVKIVDHKKNIGFGAANNLGAKIAQGRYLFFLNPDCEIVSKNIAEIIDEFGKDNNIGIIGWQLLEANGKVQKWSAGVEINLISLILNNLGLSRDRNIWKSRNKINADWVAGTAMFVRADNFSKIGGFDENFFMYFEDVDLCRRIKKSGGKAIYFPAFQVLHKGGKSYADKKLQKKHYYDSQEYYFRKHRPKIECRMIKIMRKILFL